ncbi:CBS domain-containing protein [Streptomyces sp. A5-4]|uniref:CBS domain-containing protein n=1 Tax=Streptomyces sp. A5-4 TaxID=3384771 RepID=UPI003DA84B96
MAISPHIVSDIMTHSVVTVGRRAAFKDIVELLGHWRVSAIPVTEAEGRIVGVVSDADLLPKEEFHDSNPDCRTQLRRPSDIAKAGAVTAEELMTAPAVTIHGGATLVEACRVMAHQYVKRLPVVDPEGRIEGIVSRGDLLKVFLRPDEDIAEEVRRTIVAHLFAAPAGPVAVTVTGGVVTLAGPIGDTSLIPRSRAAWCGPSTAW